MESQVLLQRHAEFYKGILLHVIPICSSMTDPVALCSSQDFVIDCG